MKNRMRVVIMTAILLVGMAVWLPGLRSRRVAAQSPVLMGSYGFTLTVAYAGGDTPGALMGVVTFDGAGNATSNATLVQVDGDPRANTVQVGQTGQTTGTYTLNADGTGTLTFPNNGATPTTVAFVITDGGAGIMVLPTGGFGNHLVTGTARKQ
jgi:hypothetical protein